MTPRRPSRLARFRRRRWARRLADPSGPFALTPHAPTIGRIRSLARALGAYGLTAGAIRWYPYVTDPMALVLGEEKAREKDAEAARREAVLSYGENHELARALSVCYASAERVLAALATCPADLAEEWTRGALRAWCELAAETAALASAEAGDVFLRTAGAGISEGASKPKPPTIDRILARLDASAHFEILDRPLADALAWLYTSGIENSIQNAERERERKKAAR